MKRSIILPIIFSLGLLCSCSNKVEAYIKPVYKIAFAGVVIATILYVINKDNKKGHTPLQMTFLCSSILRGFY